MDCQLPSRKPDCAKCAALHADLTATNAEYAAYKSKAQQAICQLQERIAALELNRDLCLQRPQGFDTRTE